MLIGRANAGALTSTSWISASGHFAAAADSDASNAPSHTFVDTGTAGNGNGFNYSVARSVIDTYGDLALRDKLLIYNLTTDPVGYADHAEISYANGAITATKPVATPGLVLAGTDVTPIVSTFGKNLISTYKNLVIHGGVGAATNDESQIASISADQLILSSLDNSSIMLRNVAYTVNVGAGTTVNMDTGLPKAFTLYAVWILATETDYSSSVAKLSLSDDLATVLNNCQSTGVTYKYGLLIGHVFTYTGTHPDIWMQPSIQYGNTMRFLFKNPTNTIVNYGASYIKSVDDVVFDQYSLAASGVNTISLAGIPSTAGTVEVIVTPPVNNSGAHFWVNAVAFDSVGGGSSNTPGQMLTAFDGRYGTASIDGTYHNPIARGWVPLVVPNTIYIQGDSGLQFTIGGWQENI